ncbi:MAG TPA: hypothetical protein VIA09_00700 [Nitrososphaeraceae archaeon]|jgi:hypothetical protein
MNNNSRSTKLKPKDSEGYIPNEALLKFLEEKKHLDEKKREYKIAGKDLPQEYQTKSEELKRMKNYFLNKHIFRPTANLVTFFEFVSKSPALQETFDNDIEELLRGSKDNGPMIFRRLLDGILTFTDNTKGKNDKYAQIDNFRVEFYYTILMLVYENLPRILRKHLPIEIINNVVMPDLARMWALTSILRKRAKEFDIDNSNRPVQF